MIKIILRILKEYKFSLLIFLVYELKYFLLNYSVWNFTTSTISSNTDNIPAPFLFLEDIFKFFKKKKIKRFIDLGCGNGRACFFFRKKNNSLLITGLENSKDVYYNNIINFKKKKIKLLFSDITKHEFNKSYDIYFLNDPLKQKKKYENLLNKIIRAIKKTSYIVTININYKIKRLKNFRPVYKRVINSKNFKIYKISKII